MIKRILMLCLTCFCLQMVFAQTMSDEEVVRFVTKQQESGKNQQYIVDQLLKKGVTVDQLRRIKSKYEAQDSQLGAMDLTGSSQNGNSQNRLRTNKEIEQEELRKKNALMIRSNREINDGMDRTVRRQQLNDEIGFMDIDSLIYYQNYFNDKGVRQVFGRNIFNNQMLTFAPSMNIPTPSDYTLGAGDNIFIDVWGVSQANFESTISPDGTITLEGVGVLKLAGMTVSEAEAYVKRELGSFYSGSSIKLTVGEVRSVQVQVMGEVVMPGTYTLSAFSTAFNALYSAGGVNEIGTLRDIKVYRNGRIISRIDVYDYILNGNLRGNIRLEDNDVIVVGPYEGIVCIDGKVKRPMYYEMKANESVATLLGYSGGFSGDAYTDNIRLIRKSSPEYSVYTIGEFEMSSFLLKDCDSLYVDSVIPRFSNMVEIRGAVFHPGQYQMGGNINTVRELIKVADGLREDAFKDHAVLHRQKDDLTMEAMSVNVEGIVSGTEPDIILRKNDVLYIPSKVEMYGQRTLKITGEVNYPGVYQYADNTTVEDLIIQAGGLTEAASTARIDVFRRIKDSNAMTSDGKLAKTYQFSLSDGLVADKDKNFSLLPYDEVVVRKSPAYSEQRNVEISGAVNFTGRYAMDNNDYRLSDLVEAAGGLSSYAYAAGARLQRRLTEEEREQRDMAFKTSQIQRYEESLRLEGTTYDIARADSILSMKMDIGDTYSVAINLEKALQNPGGMDDLRLREDDKLIVPQYSTTVKISGEVMYPISIKYEKGKSLNYYIKRAGGYADNAHKSRTYAVYMNGSVEQLGRRSRSIQPGCEIVVPTKPQKNRMKTAEIMTIGTSAASIATVIATLINILK